MIDLVLKNWASENTNVPFLETTDDKEQIHAQAGYSDLSVGWGKDGHEHLPQSCRSTGATKIGSQPKEPVKDQ